MKAYSENQPKYKKINDFFKNITIFNENLESTINSINDDDEQIYYECVKEPYDRKDEDYISFWAKLFERAENQIKAAKEKSNAAFEKTNDIIVINETEILGQWQSLEVLTGLRYSSRVFWISVDALLKTIKKLDKKYGSSDKSKSKTLIISALRKKCKPVFPSKHEKL